ncbi:acyl-CoA dehydrogenase family protein [Mycobacterium cookii]|uniref:Acyl-CoA dehydrogenase n=1 Tax=Mycobacterium cookii TaxID=1775 RepID=A0A7I7KWL6_9MYCO|nr:acyl-CoA dehydrogenase family protein [Mycobacterium cookii]MCV7332313.1 acyl-CoA dehydrogenase [Mycobacterium cookii]BBX46460.1 acyl-CoA dehydrogenase [Mycobacterium cookii]
MDVRLTAEQQQLRDAAAKLADDLGPGSVAELADDARITRLDKQIHTTGWRSLRSDEASGVEVAIVAEEFGRGLVDAPFLGPVLADDLARHVGGDGTGSTIAIDGHAIDSRGFRRALTLDGTTVSASEIGSARDVVDLTRAAADLAGKPSAVGEVDSNAAQRWLALALATTSADLVGTARGAHTLACDYAKIREQYGKSIGSYQAIAHLLAESLALIEGSISILRHAAWAVDELSPAEAIRAGRYAKVYCARAARTVCETAIQVHGGIGNTWECLAHVYLRRALTSTQLWPVKLEEIDVGLP